MYDRPPLESKLQRLCLQPLFVKFHLSLIYYTYPYQSINVTGLCVYLWQVTSWWDEKRARADSEEVGHFLTGVMDPAV